MFTGLIGRMRNRFPILALLFLLFAVPVFAGTVPVSGMILRVDASRRTVSVSCKGVPGKPDARIISVSVKDGEDLSRLHTGDIVDFNLVEEHRGYHAGSLRQHHFESIEQDPFTAHQLHGLQGAVAQTQRESAVSVGQAVPDFKLIDQNARPVRLSQFAGRVIAINFAYTRCALPQFCYRLTNNLANLQKRFSKRMGRDLVLLTISFDPVHDDPGVLAEAAKMWRADPDSWRFLTGTPEEIKRVCSRFGVDAWPDEGLMIHSLHTVVIDSSQHLVANLGGNDFTSEQLGDLVETVIDKPEVSRK